MILFLSHFKLLLLHENMYTAHLTFIWVTALKISVQIFEKIVISIITGMRTSTYKNTWKFPENKDFPTLLYREFSNLEISWKLSCRIKVCWICAICNYMYTPYLTFIWVTTLNLCTNSCFLKYVEFVAICLPNSIIILLLNTSLNLYKKLASLSTIHTTPQLRCGAHIYQLHLCRKSLQHHHISS